jgi:hypothetical protein
VAALVRIVWIVGIIRSWIIIIVAIVMIEKHAPKLCLMSPDWDMPRWQDATLAADASCMTTLDRIHNWRHLLSVGNCFADLLVSKMP